MELDVKNLIESLIRWTHVVSGILWIGLLYFFNWVNASFAPTLDADSKKKVVPELMPRTLYFFRWGAAWTWISGLLLAMLVYYETKLVFEKPLEGVWGAPSIVMLVVVFLAFIVYDRLFRMIPPGPAQFVVGWLLASGVYVALRMWAGFGFRGATIHLGAMFGTIMAANVWMRIWPNQKRIITAVKNGEKPDADMVALAGIRSKHNTYMSVPLVFTMLNAHSTWAASWNWTLPAVVLVGWLVTFLIYKKAVTVKGF
jgi:uncharacterized membrane protein